MKTLNYTVYPDVICVDVCGNLYVNFDRENWTSNVLGATHFVLYRLHLPQSSWMLEDIPKTPDVLWHKKVLVHLGGKYSFCHTFHTEDDLYDDWGFFERVFKALGYVVERKRADQC